MNITARIIAVVLLGGIAPFVVAAPVMAVDDLPPCQIAQPGQPCVPSPQPTLEQCLVEVDMYAVRLDVMTRKVNVLEQYNERLQNAWEASEAQRASAERQVKELTWENNRKFWRIYRLENKVADLKRELREARS